MSKINDGGAAFPCEQHETQDGTWNQTFEPGMSLRDWFAGQALAGMLAGCPDVSPSILQMFGGPGKTRGNAAAAFAYSIADAMLAERAKSEGQQ